MTKKNCMTCNSKFDAEEVVIMGKTISFQNYCEPCLEKSIAEAQQNAEQSRKDALNLAFWESVPPLYQDTEIERLNPILVREVLTWEFNPIGIGIRGKSGEQKTRAAVLLLHKMKLAGKSVNFLKATDVAKYAAQQFSNDKELQTEALKAIRTAHTCQVLLLDDIGKGRLSPAAEELLYDLLDKRSERKLPVIWTSNAVQGELHQMLSNDRGDAIIRRLSEFSKIITL